MSERTPEIIRNLREDHELKQDTIAKHLGVVQQTYSTTKNVTLPFRLTIC